MPELAPVPPAAFRMSEIELRQLCFYTERKGLGGLALNADETVPVGGWDEREGDEESVVIAPGLDHDYIMMHAPEVTGEGALQHDLVLAGTYIALHEQLRQRSHVVGVTFGPMAQIFERVTGLRRLRPFGVTSEKYQANLERAYGKLRIAQRRPLEVVMLYLPTDELIDRYAAKRLGRSALGLWHLLTGEDRLPTRNDP